MAEPIKLDATAPAPVPTPPIIPAAEVKSVNAPALSQNRSQSFGNIFTQAAQKEKEPQLLTTVLFQKESASGGPKSILGVAPTLEKTIELEKELRLKRRLRIAKFLLLLTFLGGLGMTGYFYIELSPAFNAFSLNATQRLANLNENLRQVQTDVNKYRYLTAQLKLNEFSYQFDNFLSNVAKKTAAGDAASGDVLTRLEEEKKALPILLNDIRANITSELVVQTATPAGQPRQNDEEILQDAIVKLKESLRRERKTFSKETSATSQEAADLKLIDNAIKLVGNKPLLAALHNISIKNFGLDLSDYAAQPDSKKQAKLQELANSILASTKSDISTIAELKQKRINWSSIIKKIANETGNISNAHYGDSVAYENYGGIVYTGYEFDTVTNKIVLSGISKTLDGTNFTLLSNLIQQLESSSDFENVEMRSFAKSKSGSGGTGEAYFANFKLDLALQKQNLSEKDRPGIVIETGFKPVPTAIPGLTPLLEKFGEFKSQVKLPFGKKETDLQPVPAADSSKKEETQKSEAETDLKPVPAQQEQPQTSPVSDKNVTAPAASAKSTSVAAPTPATGTKSVSAPAPAPVSKTSKN